MLFQADILHSFHQLEQFDVVMAAVFRTVIPAALIAILLLLTAISSPSLGSQYDLTLRFTQDEGGSENESSGENSSSNVSVDENNTKNWTAHTPVWNVGVAP